MEPKEQQNLAYMTLAKNRYAERPECISPKRWGAIKSRMEKRFMSEWMATPPGLYSDSEIWNQTFFSWAK